MSVEDICNAILCLDCVLSVDQQLHHVEDDVLVIDRIQPYTGYSTLAVVWLIMFLEAR